MASASGKKRTSEASQPQEPPTEGGEPKRPRQEVQGDGTETYFPRTSLPVEGWIQPVSGPFWRPNRHAPETESVSLRFSADIAGNGHQALWRLWRNQSRFAEGGWRAAY